MSSISDDGDTVPSAEELATYWSEESHYDPEWDGRGELAVGFLEESERAFCDIGCGARFSLKKFLPFGSQYYPADIRKWDSTVTVCDLNKGDIPIDLLKRCQVTFLLGVCEYLFDVETAVTVLSAHCPVLIVSYCSKDGPFERWNMWVNAYTEAEFKKILAASGYVVEHQIAYKPGQFIFRAVRRN